jgi:hypothetical protein
MARHKRGHENAGETGQTQVLLSGHSPRVAGPSKSTNGNKKHKKIRSGSQSSVEDSTGKNQVPEQVGVEVSESRVEQSGSSSKAKRKVTFDVKPAIVTIKREVNAEKEEEAKLASQDTGGLLIASSYAGYGEEVLT